MTTEEAIKIIREDGWGYPETMKTEAVMMAVDALEKQIKKRPIEEYVWHGISYTCPNCKKPLFPDVDCNVCSWCGQALRW